MPSPLPLPVGQPPRPGQIVDISAAWPELGPALVYVERAFTPRPGMRRPEHPHFVVLELFRLPLSHGRPVPVPAGRERVVFCRSVFRFNPDADVNAYTQFLDAGVRADGEFFCIADVGVSDGPRSARWWPYDPDRGHGDANDPAPPFEAAMVLDTELWPAFARALAARAGAAGGTPHPPPPEVGDVFSGTVRREIGWDPSRYVFVVERVGVGGVTAMGIYCIVRGESGPAGARVTHVTVVREWCDRDERGEWQRLHLADEREGYWGMSTAYVSTSDGSVTWRRDSQPWPEGVQPPPFDVALAFADKVLPRLMVGVRRARAARRVRARRLAPLKTAAVITAALWALGRSR